MVLRLDDFAPWLERWDLKPDGAPFEMAETGSRLLPVRAGETAAMLKLGRSPDERRGGRVMARWDGGGAAPVLAHDDDALLLVRAQGPRSLAEIASSGAEGEATRLICQTVAELHRPRPAPPPELPPLEALFLGLRTAAAADSRFGAAAGAAAQLLADPRELRVLHGDIHHHNILDFGLLGWRAIDPWGFVGERVYDYANVLKNPDLATLTKPGWVARQVGVICAAAGLEPRRMLTWAFAHGGLSAAWSIQDGRDPADGLALMAICGAELGL